LDAAGAFHPVFAHVGVTDLIAAYAADFFPRYAKIPAEPHVFYFGDFPNMRTAPTASRFPGDNPNLIDELRSRPNADKQMQRRKRSTTYWNCEDYIWPRIAVGQVGFISEFDSGVQLPFVIVWKHPRPDIQMFGAIFPFAEVISGRHTHEPQWGADLVGDEMTHWAKGKLTCSCVPVISRDTSPWLHKSECALYPANHAYAGTMWDKSRIAPADGLYRVLYFGLWTWEETTDRLACEVTVNGGIPTILWRLETAWGHNLGQIQLSSTASYFWWSGRQNREGRSRLLHRLFTERISLRLNYALYDIERPTQLPFLIDPTEVNDLADYGPDEEAPHVPNTCQ
jgi:hypothetical protein